MKDFRNLLDLAAIICSTMILGVKHVKEKVKFLIVDLLIYENKETGTFIPFPTHSHFQQLQLIITLEQLPIS